MLSQVPNKTETIYTLIREEKYTDVVQILESELPLNPQSRCILSLLAYCHYHLQDFHSAANHYEKLMKYFPQVEEYRVYYSQSLWKASLYDEALRASSQGIVSPEYVQQMTYMCASIKYEQNDLVSAQSILSNRKQNDVETAVGQGCILLKEEKYKQARAKFTEALNSIGYRPDLAYNIALCHYMLKDFAEMDKLVDTMIAKGANANPNLSVGSAAGGLEVKSVGLTHVLKETALIEAFNLKIAKEFENNNMEQAKSALWGMPPRDESELDPVTLHNSALLNMETDANESFRKLNFLLTQATFPAETFQNLLLSYITHGLYSIAADVLAENAHLHELYLDPELYDFIDAVLTKDTSPSEAYHRFDILSQRHIENLRTLTKKLNEAKESNDRDLMKSFVSQYLECLEKYIQVLMQQAAIYWDRENWPMIESIFEKSKEFCDNHDTWKLNLAHTLFMQENKFSQSVALYEPIVRKSADSSILSVKAMVLANLCVAYIMTSQNEEAEELMRQIEREEERLAHIQASASSANNLNSSVSRAASESELHLGNGNDMVSNLQQYHLCIVNLVIGTLYCSKGNYTFGLQRIIKSLDPLSKKLSCDTWYHAKRCFLSYLEMLTKQIFVIKDAKYDEIMVFLDDIEEHGQNMAASISVTLDSNQSQTIADEARHLKMLYLQLME